MDENENTLSGEVVVRSGANEGSLDLNRPLLQALFASVVKPVSVFRARRRKARVFDENNVLHLTEMLDQWASGLNFQGVEITASASFDSTNGGISEDIINYDSVHTFLERAPRHPGRAKYVMISARFSVFNEASGKLDYHQADIVLAGTVEAAIDVAKDEDELGSPPVFRRDDDDWSLDISVSYSNYMVARGLIGVVDEWYDSLKPIELSYKVGFVSRFVEKITISEELYDWPWKVVVPLVLSSVILILAGFLWSDGVVGGVVSEFRLYLFAILFAVISYFNAAIFHGWRPLYHRVSMPLSRLTTEDKEEQKKTLNNIETYHSTRLFWERTFVVEVAAAILGAAIAIFTV